MRYKDLQVRKNTFHSLYLVLVKGPLKLYLFSDLGVVRQVFTSFVQTWPMLTLFCIPSPPPTFVVG